MAASFRRTVFVGIVLVTVTACSGRADNEAKPSPSATSDGPTLASVVLPAPSEARLPRPVERRIERLLDDWSELSEGGLTAAVVTSEGSWTGAVGADGAGVPLRPESAQAVGSITKTFVAAEVMTLVRAGKVDLDVDAEEYVDLPFDGQGATVRELLGMESGYPADPVDTLIRRISRTSSARSWSRDDVLELVPADASRQGERGGPPSYNNLNFWVLGALVEQVTGEPLAVSIRRDLIEPAGLERVWLQDAERPLPPLARAHRATGGGLSIDVAMTGPYLPSRAIASSAGAPGGIASDAATIARWVYLLYGGRVIDPELVAEMTYAEDGDDWYGLGTVVGESEGDRVVGHDGDVLVYHSIALLWPEQEVAVAVLVPQSAELLIDTAPDVAEKLAALVLPD